jgi:hypothetical protein
MSGNGAVLVPFFVFLFRDYLPGISRQQSGNRFRDLFSVEKFEFPRQAAASRGVPRNSATKAVGFFFCPWRKIAAFRSGFGLPRIYFRYFPPGRK